ncbi:MAG: hypothetical protein ACLR8L_06700 [Oscillospiraceae bacterium]
MRTIGTKKIARTTFSSSMSFFPVQPAANSSSMASAARSSSSVCRSGRTPLFSS